MDAKEIVLYVMAVVAFAASASAYLYGSRYTGLLPVITYPFRDYALPLAVIGVILLVAALALGKSQAKRQSKGFATQRPNYELRFFMLAFSAAAFFMKIVSEAVHELLGHGLFIVLFGGRIVDFCISILWPYELSHIDWVLAIETHSQTVWITVGGILTSAIFSFLVQLLLLRKKSCWQASLPLFWLSFWCFTSASGYLILGGFFSFGDVRNLVQLGALTSASSVLMGVAIFLAGFFFLSRILREMLTPLLGVETRWVVLFLWFLIPVLLLLTMVGRRVFDVFLLSASMIPILLSCVLEF